MIIGATRIPKKRINAGRRNTIMLIVSEVFRFMNACLPQKEVASPVKGKATFLR
jgi:hypothetical protein